MKPIDYLEQDCGSHIILERFSSLDFDHNPVQAHPKIYLAVEQKRALVVISFLIEWSNQEIT